MIDILATLKDGDSYDVLADNDTLERSLKLATSGLLAGASILRSEYTHAWKQFVDWVAAEATGFNKLE